MRVLGFGSLVWICKVLLSKEETNIKLSMIHVRSIIWCYIFLFIVRCLIVGIIISHGKLWFLISLLGCYLSISFISGIDDFIKSSKEWESDKRLTLYDIKKMYIKKQHL